MTSRFPGIKRAALKIAYDNGGINRTRPVEQMLRELERWLQKQPGEVLPAIDAWLSSLSDEDLHLVCSGDYDEGQPIMERSPPFTDDFLDRCFDEVC